MPFVTALRSSSVLWGAFPLFALTAFLVVEWSRFAEPGFGTAVAEATAFPVFAVAAICSACAAWEGGRLRRGGVWFSAPVRGRLRILVNTLSPVLALGSTSFVIAFIFASSTLGTFPDTLDLLPLASAAVVMISYTVLGFCVGCATPRVIGAPLMLIGVYVWMTVPASSDIMWIRHLSGVQITSSSVVDSVEVTAFTAPVVLSVSLTLAFLPLMSGAERSLRETGAAVCCGVIGSLVAWSLVADWGPGAPTTPRAGAIVCAESNPTICLPKEYSGEVPRLHRIAGDVLADLEAAGFDRPHTLALVSAESPVSPGTWRFAPHPEHDDEFLRATIAWSAIPDSPDCFAQDDGYPGSDEDIRVWLLLLTEDGGTPGATLPEDTTRHVLPVLELPREEQMGWFDATVEALNDCAPTPEPPGRST
ncbi:DUF7224 domain-containing protein [Streptomyces alkaliphilus]|uniref:DUF7224 domain-containing protein n=1 Tax=Streptomyces alkaliphilus TaxID=1472722 RepID=UPI00117E6054|nr:hypothetical protein [Streptomyces alkaliphilus]MQS07238.1 hypothetical protein [Streptomyces alkaliphilus]